MSLDVSGMAGLNIRGKVPPTNVFGKSSYVLNAPDLNWACVTDQLQYITS